MSIDTSLKGVFRAVVLGWLVLGQQARAGDAKQCAAPEPEVDATYSPGQVWSYKTRPGEASSTVTILRVERTAKLGVILHVRVDGVRFRNCAGDASPDAIGHAPFARSAMDRSVGRVLKTVAKLPEFEAGYEDWLAHCGGVYSVTVAEMVDADEAAFRAGLGCTA